MKDRKKRDVRDCGWCGREGVPAGKRCKCGAGPTRTLGEMLSRLRCGESPD